MDLSEPSCSTDRATNVFYGRIRHENFHELLKALARNGKRLVRSRLDTALYLPVVLLRKKSLGDDDVQVNTQASRAYCHQQHRRRMLQNPTQRSAVPAE